jgi:hypothetical protein
MTEKDMTTKLNALEQAIEQELQRVLTLEEVGFEVGDCGQLYAENCRVTFYSVMGEWEVDIALPNGNAVGFDVPYSAAEMVAWRPKKPAA